jgi:hypothetical protein
VETYPEILVIPFNDVISRSHKLRLQRCDALFARPGKKEHQVTGIVDPGAAGGILAGKPVIELFDFRVHIASRHKDLPGGYHYEAGKVNLSMHQSVHLRLRWGKRLLSKLVENSARTRMPMYNLPLESNRQVFSRRLFSSPEKRTTVCYHREANRCFWIFHRKPIHILPFLRHSK